MGSISEKFSYHHNFPENCFGFDFTYSDNGIGVPDNFDFKQQKTLGFKLITGIARDQMGGVVDFRNTEGLTCHIVVSDVIYEARI